MNIKTKIQYLRTFSAVLILVIILAISYLIARMDKEDIGYVYKFTIGQHSKNVVLKKQVTDKNMYLFYQYFSEDNPSWFPNYAAIPVGFVPKDFATKYLYNEFSIRNLLISGANSYYFAIAISLCCLIAFLSRKKALYINPDQDTSRLYGKARSAFLTFAILFILMIGIFPPYIGTSYTKGDNYQGFVGYYSIFKAPSQNIVEQELKTRYKYRKSHYTAERNKGFSSRIDFSRFMVQLLICLTILGYLAFLLVR